MAGTRGVRCFPILTLSGESLSAALGFVFDPRWVHRHESLLSLMWKFIAINGAPAHVVIPHLDARADAFAGFAPYRSPALCTRAARLLGVSRHVIARGLLPESVAAVASPHFRFCWRCARRGFHSVLFQFPHIRTCPLHNLLLSEQCPFCKERTPHQLRVLTLERPYACAHCGRRFCPALLKRLGAARQPEGRKVPAFEAAYLKQGYHLLGYPGTRTPKPYELKLLPPEVVRELHREYEQLRAMGVRRYLDPQGRGD
jgi:hypothetical protein